MNSNIILNSKQIQKRILELANEISDDYAGKQIFAICGLNESFMFTSDLLRKIKGEIFVNFIDNKTAKGESSLQLALSGDLSYFVKNRDILLIAVKSDSIKNISETLKRYEPSSLKICALLANAKNNIESSLLAYIGFRISEKRIFGYGIDYHNKYCNLDYISAVHL